MSQQYENYKPVRKIFREGDKWYRVIDGKTVEATDINNRIHQIKQGIYAPANILTHQYKMEMQEGEVEDV